MEVDIKVLLACFGLLYLYNMKIGLGLEESFCSLMFCHLSLEPTFLNLLLFLLSSVREEMERLRLFRLFGLYGFVTAWHFIHFFYGMNLGFLRFHYLRGPVLHRLTKSYRKSSYVLSLESSWRDGSWKLILKRNLLLKL